MKKFRESLGMSQQQLADFLYVSRSFISLVEMGQRILSIDQIHRILLLQKHHGQLAGAPLPDPAQPRDPAGVQAIVTKLKEREQLLQYRIMNLRKKLAAMQQTLWRQQQCLELCSVFKDTDEGSAIWSRMYTSTAKVKAKRINEKALYFMQLNLGLLEQEAELLKAEVERLGGS